MPPPLKGRSRPLFTVLGVRVGAVPLSSRTTRFLFASLGLLILLFYHSFATRRWNTNHEGIFVHRVARNWDSSRRTGINLVAGEPFIRKWILAHRCFSCATQKHNYPWANFGLTRKPSAKEISALLIIRIAKLNVFLTLRRELIARFVWIRW